MPSLKERAKTLIELLDSSRFLWADRPLRLEDKAQALLTPEARGIIATLVGEFEAIETWNAETTEAAVRAFAERSRPQARRGRAAAAGGADRPRHVAGYL